MESFGTIIHAARLKSGWRQIDLAAEVGISWMTLLRIEKDRRRPDHETALKLAELLDIPVSTIGKFFRKTHVFAE